MFKHIYYSRAPILVKVKSLFYWKVFLKESLANPFHRSNWLKTTRKTSHWLKKKGENTGSCVRECALIVLVLCSNNLIVNINEVSNNVSLNITYLPYVPCLRCSIRKCAACVSLYGFLSTGIFSNLYFSNIFHSI